MRVTCLLYAVLHVAMCAAAVNLGSDTRWTSVQLEDPGRDPDVSEEAVAIGQTRDDHFIVIAYRSSAQSAVFASVVYKVSISGVLIWTKEINSTRGIPFDVHIDQSRDAAYVIFSSVPPESTNSSGHVVRLSHVSEKADSSNITNVVKEETIFSTSSKLGGTKLISSVINPKNGDLYVTGGIIESILEKGKGVSDAIIIRLSASGEVLGMRRLRTMDDEFGTAVDICMDSSVIAVAVHRVTKQGGNDAVLYRLDAHNLTILNGSQTMDTDGGNEKAFFFPSALAISGPYKSHPDVMTFFVAGSSFNIANHKQDMFGHLFSDVHGKEVSVAVSIDGSADKKLNDYGVAVCAGQDGNFYYLGYTVNNRIRSEKSFVLTVISPRGDILLRTGEDNAGLAHGVPRHMITIGSRPPTRLLFAGFTQRGSTRKAMIGIAEPPLHAVPPFGGFEQGETDSGDAMPGSEDPSSPKKVPIAFIFVGIGAGVLAGILGIAAVVAIHFCAQPKIREGSDVQNHSNSIRPGKR